VADLCDHGNKLLGTITRNLYLRIPEEDSAPIYTSDLANLLVIEDAGTKLFFRTLWYSE
jgi:hypothetical protein